MDPLVVFEGIGPVEPLAALVAAVTALAAVDQPVLVVNGPGQEAFVAQLAVIRTLSGVALANVVLQVGPDREASVAAHLRTLEGSNAVVEAQVLPEVAGLGVRLAAQLA